MIDEAQAARDSVSATLVDRLMATLDDRPFLPLSRGAPPDPDALRWENEGGATLPGRPGSRD